MCQYSCNHLNLTHEELQAIAQLIDDISVHPNFALNGLELNLLRKIERHLKKHEAMLDTNPASA